jgi:hypothetical protein
MGGNLAWIDLAQNKDGLGVAANTVTNIRFYKI